MKKIKPSYLNNEQTIEYLLKPSWFSGLVAIFCGLAVAVGVLVVFSLNNSEVQQQLVGLQSTDASPSLTLPGQAPPNTNENSLQNTWPLMAFWGFMGLLAYFVLEEILGLIRNIYELRRELEYVHSDRDALIKSAVINIAIRIVVVVVWLIFTDFFFKRIIPYSITASHATASDPVSWSGVLYLLLSFGLIALSMHLHTIFARVALRRPRVFSSTGY